MKTEKTQTYTPEFRESSVKLALDSDQSIKQTAEGLGIKPSTLHTWIGKYTKPVSNNKKQVVIYTLLAIPFASYLQPFIVMSVIPFGIVGAVLGHLFMGMNLTINSVLGMLALSGVVVNDSLVLIDRFNQLRKKGEGIVEAIINSGCCRFRAILLTSLTTFVGLVPLIFEQATQAQFLIPMAVSLGFGILFTTLVTLILVPIFCVILEDFKLLFKKTATL